ncbi:MAG: WXG100 family type VII secretion target [Atopobiaceae bacterium]|nr:WXG100 family type VII secretion target [Atopobiaceae bacterium]
MSMEGYEIHFDEASNGASQLQKIIEGLQEQLQKMSSTEEQFLNDQLWYGPNKTKFSQRFEEYKKAVENLLTNASEHHTALVDILNAYQKAES